ncbi:MAG: TlpA family protein disulfide reductase [Planctomycetes bacterium]|nr:TlpA family protein disulfide reductase [Planctomycetota bacterium]
MRSIREIRFCFPYFIAVICMLTFFSTHQLMAFEKKQPSNVTLKIKNWQDVQKRVATHKGKVVVVDIWTTTCLTCVEEFPKFAALQKKYGKDKVICISLNCDYDGIESKPPKYYREKVLKFLRKQNASFENVMLNVPFLAFLDNIKLESTPAILVFGPSTKLAKRFDNDDAKSEKDDYLMEDVEALIERLLKK